MKDGNGSDIFTRIYGHNKTKWRFIPKIQSPHYCIHILNIEQVLINKTADEQETSGIPLFNIQSIS